MASTMHRDAPQHVGATEFSAKPYHRGYLTPSELKPAIAAAHRSRPWVTLAAALADHLMTYALLVAVVWTVSSRWWVLGLLVVPLAVFGIGRNLRALECLIHEGSHFNWSRTRHRLNDVLTFVTSGLPAGIRVGDYRASHLLHHGQFGTAADPDRRRYIELDIESMPRDSWRTFLPGLLRRLPRYQLGWLRELGAHRLQLAMPLSWAVVAVGVPFWFATGTAGSIWAVAVWLAGHLVALPVVRFLGEASEHVYTGTDVVFDATVSNLGRAQALFIHPHNDGYHTVHHMWPGVPHHALRRLHKLLMAEDPLGYGARLRHRTRFMQAPQYRAERYRADRYRAG